jgi:hypothetical protein
MNNSELSGKLSTWLADFESLREVSIPAKDKLIMYLAGRISDSVFIESDPDVLTLKIDGRTQYARITKEDKVHGVVHMQMLNDLSFMVLTYAALKELCPGAQIVAALDAVNGKEPTAPFKHWKQ